MAIGLFRIAAGNLRALAREREDRVAIGRLHADQLAQLDHRGQKRIQLDRPTALQILQHRGLVRADRVRPVDALLDIDGELDAQLLADLLALGHHRAHQRPRAGIAGDDVERREGQDAERVERGEMLSMQDVLDILAIPLIGIIPESKAVLKASNTGTPVILDDNSDAGVAYQDAIERFLGETVPFKFVHQERKGILRRIFGKAREGMPS